MLHMSKQNWVKLTESHNQTVLDWSSPSGSRVWTSIVASRRKEGQRQYFERGRGTQRFEAEDDICFYQLKANAARTEALVRKWCIFPDGTF